jgi:hypothetical protein
MLGLFALFEPFAWFDLHYFNAHMDCALYLKDI